MIDTLCAQMIIYTKVLDIIRIRGNTLYGHKKFFSMIYSNNIQPGNCILYLMFSNGISFEYKYQKTLEKTKDGTIQRYRQHWAHKTYDEDNQSKSTHTTTQKTKVL